MLQICQINHKYHKPVPDNALYPVAEPRIIDTRNFFFKKSLAIYDLGQFNIEKVSQIHKVFFICKQFFF